MTRLVLLGSKARGLGVLRAVLDRLRPPHRLVGVLCPDDASDARSVLSEFRDCAHQHGVALEVAANARETRSAMERWRADTALVAGWYQMIRLEEFPATRFFGFHASPLPKYRGNAPLVWQILRGELAIGVSFFQITEGMDEGGIVAQAQAPLGADETIDDALRFVQASCREIVLLHLVALLDGTATLSMQEHAQATYCGLRVAEDGRIDWHRPARQVHDFVRAQTRPYPGAFSRFADGRKLIVWRSVVDARSYCGVPGAVAERGPGVVVVTCGDGAIRILEAEIEGAAYAPVDALIPSLRTRLS